MRRLTLRVPDQMHAFLKVAARRDGVSVNAFVVAALAQHINRSATAEPASDLPSRQRAAFVALLEQLGQASPGDVKQKLAGRSGSQAEQGLTPQLVRRLRRKVLRR